MQFPNRASVARNKDKGAEHKCVFLEASPDNRIHRPKGTSMQRKIKCRLK